MRKYGPFLSFSFLDEYFSAHSADASESLGCTGRKLLCVARRSEPQSQNLRSHKSCRSLTQANTFAGDLTGFYARKEVQICYSCCSCYGLGRILEGVYGILVFIGLLVILS